MDVRLGGDLLVYVGLGRDLHVLVGHDLGRGHGGGQRGEEHLRGEGVNPNLAYFSYVFSSPR